MHVVVTVCDHYSLTFCVCGWTSLSLLLLSVSQGITYSVMSASWDENREGDLLGTDEFAKNVDNIKEGLSRSRANALLRDRIATDPNLQQSLSELEKRRSQSSPTSLEEKLKEELE